MENEFYRNCIQEELARRCERNPRYSLRSYAKALGIDAAALSRILSNKLVPSLKLAQKLMRELDLSPGEQMRFMASLGQAHRSRNYQRLSPVFRNAETVSGPVKELSADLFRIIADWYHYAILELTFTSSFKPDPNWIASELGITPLEAKLAVERLVSLGLLEKSGRSFVKTDQRITTADKQVSSAALRRRQKQILTKAIDSLENDRVEVRSNTTMTMAVDPRKISQAKEKILKFNRELCEFLESGERTQVYELAISLFPVQKEPIQKEKGQ